MPSFLPASVTSITAAQLESTTQVLVPGKKLSWQTSNHANLATYQIFLSAGEYVDFRIIPAGVELLVTLRQPNGQSLQHSTYPDQESLTLSMIAPAAGPYLIQFQPLSKDSQGSFTVEAQNLRIATERDTNLVEARNACLDGERLRNEWRADSLHQAIAQFERSLTFWRAASDRLGEANAYQSIGDLYYLLGTPKQAIEYYNKANTLIKTQPDRRAESNVLNKIGYANIFIGKNQEALSLCERALTISQATADRKQEAQSLNNIGEVYYAFSDLRRALEYFNRALQIRRELGHRGDLAETLMDLGYTYHLLSDFPKALDFYSQSLALWRTVKNPRSEAEALNCLANVNSLSGEKQAALVLYDEALRISQTIGDRYEEAIVLNCKAGLYENMGDFKTALALYLQALTLFQQIDRRPGEALGMFVIGRANYSSGKYEDALEYLQKAVVICHEISDQQSESFALRYIGMVHEALGNKQKALEVYNTALTLNRKFADTSEESSNLDCIGHIYETSGDYQRALSYYKRALPLAKASGLRDKESLTLYNIAHVQRSLGALSDAGHNIEASLEIVESLHSKVASEDLRTSYFASVNRHYELYIDLLMQKHKANGTAGYDSLAFLASERSRARSLLESLREARAEIRLGVDDSLLQKERSLEQQLNGKAQRQVQLMASKDKDGAEALEKEIDSLTTQYDEVKAQIRIANPHYAALTQPKPLRLDEIQQSLADDAMLLEYALGDERTYLWAITRSEVHSYELPARAEIEGPARNLYDLLVANQPKKDENFEQRQSRVAKADEELSAQIERVSSLLLSPVAPKLTPKRLLIVADGALQYIPFQILMAPVADPSGEKKLRPLVEDHEIVNEPSASALSLLVNETKNRKQPSNSVAVLADPVFESDDPRLKSVTKPSTNQTSEQPQETEFHQALRDVNLSGDGHIPRLLASRAEANAIMAVTPWRSGFEAMDFEASRATVTKTDLSDYRIVHFATHGLLNNEHPELSGIVLSLFDQKGQPQDGYLRLHDIYNLRLPVDLVVLSACNTGLGKDVRGEGLIGLTRGFMYAGASSVVASLWKVDDEATSELMRLFYGYMLRDGLSPAAALRKAQVTMSQQKRWQSPYYWAGFVIQGQYIPSERVNRFSSQRVVLLIVVAVILSTAAFYALRRRRRISL